MATNDDLLSIKLKHDSPGTDQGRLSKFVQDVQVAGRKPGNSQAQKPQTSEIKYPRLKVDTAPLLMPLTPMLDTRDLNAIEAEASKAVDIKAEKGTPIVPISREELNQKVEHDESSSLAMPDLQHGVPKKQYFDQFKFKDVAKDSLPTVLFVVDYSWSMIEPELVKKLQERHQPVPLQSIDYAEKTLEAICKTLPDNINVGIRVFGAKPLYKEAYEACNCHQSELVEEIRPLRAKGEESVYDHFATIKDAIKARTLHKTPIPFALESAITSDLHGISGKKLVVFITDGLSTCGEDPVATAQRLAGNPDAQDVDLNVYALNMKGVKGLKGITDALHGKVNNPDNEHLQSSVMKHVRQFVGGQVITDPNASFRVINGTYEDKKNRR